MSCVAWDQSHDSHMTLLYIIDYLKGPGNAI